MEKVVKEKTLGIGSQAGARDALTGPGFKSAFFSPIERTGTKVSPISLGPNHVKHSIMSRLNLGGREEANGQKNEHQSRNKMSRSQCKPPFYCNESCFLPKREIVENCQRKNIQEQETVKTDCKLSCHCFHCFHFNPNTKTLFLLSDNRIEMASNAYNITNQDEFMDYSETMPTEGSGVEAGAVEEASQKLSRSSISDNSTNQGKVGLEGLGKGAKTHSSKSKGTTPPAPKRPRVVFKSGKKTAATVPKPESSRTAGVQNSQQLQGPQISGSAVLWTPSKKVSPKKTLVGAAKARAGPSGPLAPGAKGPKLQGKTTRNLEKWMTSKASQNEPEPKGEPEKRAVVAGKPQGNPKGGSSVTGPVVAPAPKGQPLAESEGGRVAAAGQGDTRKPSNPRKRTHDKPSYAEVCQRDQVCLIREKGGRTLGEPDMIKVQSWIMRTAIRLGKALELRVTQGGYRDGGIWIALATEAAVSLLKAQMHLLKPIMEGDSGYVLFGPGETPFEIFWVTTSDEDAMESPTWFADYVRMVNPELFEGGVQGEIRVLENRKLHGKPGYTLKVAVGRDLLPNLAKLNYRLVYGIGKVFFRKIVPSSQREQAPTSGTPSGGQAKRAAREQDKGEVMDTDDGADVVCLDGDDGSLAATASGDIEKL